MAMCVQIPRKNFAAVTAALENRAKSVIGQRLDVNTDSIVNVIVWGNINGENYIDTSQVMEVCLTVMCRICLQFTVLVEHNGTYMDFLLSQHHTNC